MTNFTNGPAAGVTLSLRRAPLFLRVVRDEAGKWDALDLVSDIVAPGEAVYAYRRTRHDGTVHVDGRDKNGRRYGEWFQLAEYALVEPQPPEAVLRDTRNWQGWATAEHARRKEAPGE